MMASELSNKDQKENESIIADAMMDENIIAKYLESHPDFFQRHADLLANIQVPHGAGTASLIERQVAILPFKRRTAKISVRKKHRYRKFYCTSTTFWC